MKKKVFSILALLLMAAGSAVAQNTNSANVQQLTKTASGTWTLNQMPAFDGILEITFREAFTLDSIPLTWTVIVDSVDKTQQVTPYTSEQGDTTLGWLNILEGSFVELIPPTVVKPTVKSVTLVDNSTPAEESVTLSTPLTLEALTAGTIVVQDPQSGMQYTLNGGAKTAVTSDAITVAVGDKVAFYGNGTSITCYNNTHIAGGTAQVKAYGNIMSLVDENGYETATTLPSTFTFNGLFYNNQEPSPSMQEPDCSNTTLMDVSGLLLPATAMTQTCYSDMFRYCVNITTPPALPATTLARSCYSRMFGGCTSLTSVPELPVTAMDEYCYTSMFEDCSSLTTVPSDLLPATALANGCYNSMFHNCTNLTAAPELPVTALATGCYAGMFNGCSALTEAPLLPATTLATTCYLNMFNGCSNLGSVTCMATDVSASSCTFNWLNNAGSNVTGTKTFTTPSTTNWSSDVNGIPSGWTRQNPDGSE